LRDCVSALELAGTSNLFVLWSGTVLRANPLLLLLLLFFLGALTGE